MKTGVVAALVFVAAFIITTAALIYFNTQYKNIFKFDFSPVNHSAIAMVDSTALKQGALSDSTKALDSLKNIANGLAPMSDSAKTAQTAKSEGGSTPQTNANGASSLPVNLQSSTGASKSYIDSMVKNEINNAEIKKMDAAAYIKWKKQTAGIIEAMDSKKASQVLRMYADNIGNELLYLMKKKKAAEILSRFDTQKDSLIIRKLTRMQ